ncbi:MAG: dienelactone hydrolase family protein [Myxococcota bacterium]
MCDERAFDDMEAAPRNTARLTRREFGALSAGAGFSMLWPGAVEAEGDVPEVTGRDLSIPTPDGTADAWFVHPTAGKAPAVLLWPDAFGLRPAMKQMANRLARSGYAVLVMNPYYRIGPAPLPEPDADFTDPDTRKRIFGLIRQLTAETQTSDAQTFIEFLDGQPSVDTKRQMGTLGYCMGGPMTMRTAAARPDRIGAGASFHGGRLVTDQPDSPHLLVPKIDSRFLFAIAENDDEAQPEAKDVLGRAFADRRLDVEIEVYEGALHGWCPPDSRVYHEAQAERAWGRLLALFETALT